MMTNNQRFSTGLSGLDQILKGLLPGDNVVWQVASIDDYLPFVEPYVKESLERGFPVVYFRFAKHPPLVSAESGAAVYELHPEEGFEAFLTEIHRVIELTGRGGCYVFDLLSDLAVDWYSDRMVGNFFMLTCPYLYDMETIAYFALLRNYHSAHATIPIAETTQLFLDVFSHQNRRYLHPLKVQHRYSSTMHMLHSWENESFVPVRQSAVIAEVMNSNPLSSQLNDVSRLGVWNRTFLRAREIYDKHLSGEATPLEVESVFQHILRMIISRDPRVLELAGKYFSLEDLLAISSRLVGTGLVGGKAVGMLLARAILKKQDPKWRYLLEPHDSFFIGSDVFYTYLVQNGCWWVRQKQRAPETFLEGAEQARRRILTGTFPDYIKDDFAAILEYYGQSPLIVRSSSLLEDNFGNSFAGKYESVFCPNQGPFHRRLEDFLSAIRTIYASTMSEKALTYRAQRGMLARDEQMALLVQRVSGSFDGNLYFPHLAGVGLSFNPFVWNELIQAEAGVLRLVFGLGTRAVDQSDDDYTRVVALNAPERCPGESGDDAVRYSQRRVDVLDLESNRHTAISFEDTAQRCRFLPLDMLSSRNHEIERRASQEGIKQVFSRVLTFDKLLRETTFVANMREMLKTLEQAYDYPVDTEFTANFINDKEYRVNLVQCRPLQVKGGGAIIDPPDEIPAEDQVFGATGAVIGHSRIQSIDRVVYVVPSQYGELPVGERYTVARLIRRVTRALKDQGISNIMLLGPGRWGTTTPALGVPVSFAEVCAVNVLVEIVAMREDLVPDVSLGTHFFNEMVEADILYCALFPQEPNNLLAPSFFDESPNLYRELLPEAPDRSEIIRVIDPCQARSGHQLRIYCNTLKQRVSGYLVDPELDKQLLESEHHKVQQIRPL